MENTYTGASHAHTPDVYDTHNDGSPLRKIPESVGSSVRSHTVKHVGPLPRPCSPELSKSWPHLDHRQASAHRSSVHHRPQCATMLPRRSPRDCNDFPGFRHHVGDVNQAQCRRAYSRQQLVSFNGGRRNCACAFYCIKGQYIVFQPTTTAICRTCTVVIKKYGLPLVAFTNTKL